MGQPNIEALRISNRLTITDISKLIGVTLLTYKRKLQGLSKWYVHEVVILAKYFNIKNSEVLEIVM